jgi:hypothetical protein
VLIFQIYRRITKIQAGAFSGQRKISDPQGVQMDAQKMNSQVFPPEIPAISYIFQHAELSLFHRLTSYTPCRTALELVIF